MKLPESKAVISKTWRIDIESEAEAWFVYQWLDRTKLQYYFKSTNHNSVLVWATTSTPDEDILLQLKFAGNLTLTEMIYIPANNICTLSEINFNAKI